MLFINILLLICVYIYIYTHTYIYIYIYIYIITIIIITTILDAGVCEKTFLLCKPWPRKPAAETALQPLIWHCESLSSYIGFSASAEECFCSQTPVSL